MSAVTLFQRGLQWPRQHPNVFLRVAAAVWCALCRSLAPAS